MGTDDFKFTVRLKADFGDRVTIPELQVSGIIKEVSMSRKGTLYRVDYFFNGDQKEAWVLSSQFERAT